MTVSKKTFLIVGLGRFGTSLCEKLSDLGQTVIGVDSLSAPVVEMADKIDVAAQVDVADEASLVKVGAKEVDVAVVTIGEAIEKSILCASILVDLGVPFVIARASNPLHAKVLRRVGVHKIVAPELDMGRRTAENLVYPWYANFNRIDGGDFVLGKISPLPEMVGMSMAELRFSQRYNVIVMLFESDGTQSAPSASRLFEKEDKLWVLVHMKDVDKLITKNSSDIDGLNELILSEDN